MTFYYNNILDLKTFFINEISGSLVIFLFLALFFIMLIAAQMRFPNVVTFSIAILFFLLIGAFYQSVLALIAFIIGSFIAWALARLISGNK